MISVTSVTSGDAGWQIYVTFCAEESDLGNLSHWLRDTLEHNFLLVAFGSVVIASAITSPKEVAKLLNPNTDEGDELRWSTDNRYELRCSENDASVFLLKYGERA